MPTVEKKRTEMSHETCLFGKDIIGKGSDAGGIGDEVSDRFHYIP